MLSAQEKELKDTVRDDDISDEAEARKTPVEDAESMHEDVSPVEVKQLPMHPLLPLRNPRLAKLGVKRNMYARCAGAAHTPRPFSPSDKIMSPVSKKLQAMQHQQYASRARW
jgi:hypothetical protein